MTSKATSANAHGAFEPFPIDVVPWEEFTYGTRFGMRYQHLSSYGGATQIGISNEVLAPGRQANQSTGNLSCTTRGASGKLGRTS